MIAANITKHTVLAQKVWAARDFRERIEGLIVHKPLERGEGFLIPHCKGIHTFAMSYTIDVIYLDSNGKILALKNKLTPNSIGPIHFKTNAVLELPSGVIDETKTERGDVIVLSGAEKPRDQDQETVFAHMPFHLLKIPA
ncbi:MAG: DUF192 domain-containing protein [Candidatus Omnitrophica bacterium]|nr:DUF192 domain-containing protein [Candidatus Omnitrophota bacterium]